MRTVHSIKSQRGVSLLEALVSVLIFSVGILAIVALQAQSVKASSEAKYRADASYLANQLLARMWVDRGNLATYQHRPGGAACAPTGANSGNAWMTTWLTNVQGTLPGATDALQQVVVDAATNTVTVNVCWQVGSDRRQYVVSTQING